MTFKTFCDVCGREIDFMSSLLSSGIRGREICNKCFKEFKKWVMEKRTRLKK